MALCSLYVLSLILLTLPLSDQKKGGAIRIVAIGSTGGKILPSFIRIAAMSAASSRLAEPGRRNVSYGSRS